MTQIIKKGKAYWGDYYYVEDGTCPALHSHGFASMQDAAEHFSRVHDTDVVPEGSWDYWYPGK